MELRTIERDGLTVVAGPPGTPCLSRAADVTRLIEACLGALAEAVLLDVANLPPGFFDLATGEAGEILQKLRNYRLRLAVVCPPGTVTIGERFGQLVAEERRGPYLALVESEEAAWDWLAETA
jgi:hypothetical protein